MCAHASTTRTFTADATDQVYPGNLKSDAASAKDVGGRGQIAKGGGGENNSY